MAGRKGLQHWLEEGAQGPAFVAVLVALVLRSAQFYSGGALSLARILGPGGLLAFDFVTGLGIAVGAELLMATAGRARRRYLAEMREIAARRGLTKQERGAMLAHYRDQARANGLFSVVGAVATIVGAMSFLLQANGNHAVSAVAVELVVSLLLVAVSYYFGVINERVPSDPAKIATENALTIRADLTRGAGQRIAAGQGTPQDVRLVAESLPRAERARFRTVLAADTDTDPLWTSQQIAAWLGALDDLSVRRRIARRLRQAEEDGRDIRRDERGAYVLARSLVLSLFADDFLSMAGGRDTHATRPRQAAVLRLVPEPHARDTDTTPTAVGQE